MEIDILFKAKPTNNTFKELSGGWYLAPTDQDTYKYALQNIRTACPDGLQGIKLKIRNFKYTDPKMLWASINIDAILTELNPGGNNISTWISDTLDVVGNDSSNIIGITKDLGVWVDENDLAIIVDAWESHRVSSKEDYSTILKVINICNADANISSVNDAIEVIRQYNKASNSIISDFLCADAHGIIRIAKDQFDCDIEMMIDTEDIKPEDTVSISKQSKGIIWKNLVHNRGKIESLGFNVDTSSDDIEICGLKVYDDVKGKLDLSDVVIYTCGIKNAVLKNCVVFKSTFTKCTFDNCKTLGVRVKIKDCKNYKEGLEGQYTILDDKE